MEKQKPWQLFIILAVIGLTLINILPTIFYYTNPLKSPINKDKADRVAERIVKRVDRLEEQNVAWLKSFASLIGVKPSSVSLMENDPNIIAISFDHPQDAKRFSRFLTPAGNHISFIPAQMSVVEEPDSVNPLRVLVRRNVGVSLDPKEIDTTFTFAKKYDDQKLITPEWKEMVFDRVKTIAQGFSGPSEEALVTSEALQTDDMPDNLFLDLAKKIVEADQAFGQESSIAKRIFASFTQITGEERTKLPGELAAKFQKMKNRLSTVADNLAADAKTNEFGGEKESEIALLASQVKTLDKAAKILKNNTKAFTAGKEPLSSGEIGSLLQKGESLDGIQTFSLEGRNPFVEALIIDWDDDIVSLSFYDDVIAIHESEKDTESLAIQKEQLDRLIFNELADAQQRSDEIIAPYENTYAIKLSPLINPSSYLGLNLGALAGMISDKTAKDLLPRWMPQNPDFARSGYPILTYKEFQKLSPREQKFGLIVYAPSMYDEAAPQGFTNDSIYIIARSISDISDKYLAIPNAPEAKTFQEDLRQLAEMLSQYGYQAYSGNNPFIDPQFKDDIIFRLDNYYSPLIGATREDFLVKGSKREASLFFTDYEQRLITLNKIEDRIQEDLVKWEEEYQTAQISSDPTLRYLVPMPTQSPFFQNLMLSTRKYFRGDERKILTWGLDLSGGKTVRIGLRDQSGRPVTEQTDLTQAVSELYKRVNSMGVAERTIRIENTNIVMDFPGSQAFSAAELIKPASMTFHIVNEKFTENNANLKDAVGNFLQDVWNEAVLNNRTDIESINDIAWRQLGGDAATDVVTNRRSEAASLLWESGLRLPQPGQVPMTSAFNDTLSTVGRLSGDSPSAWEGKTHPLIILFHNYALDGASLSDVRVGYDQMQGNVLSFSVKNSFEGDRSGSPRDDLYAWTSQFAKDRIEGTEKENYSRSGGWRMAVILNGQIISSPALNAALNEGGTISGRFTQREINKLAADLKAGSLTYVPKILSEENVSPELGKTERTKGILAAIAGLILVVAIMSGYYRFAGVIASIAVIFNILIMWGVLQNIGAVITLPGLAGIVLTIGMAVDANVLVFERIREEFKQSGRIASAIQTGYKKAFSAIVDSNITTIIAALILLQFDSGPIRGFAVTLIIGIVSSMFTALFMTRYFFAGWVKNPKHKELKMSSLIGATKIDFLKYTRVAVVLSLFVIGAGGYAFFKERNTLFGMDFTGGYSLSLELEESPAIKSYREAVTTALQKAGATLNDFQIRQLNRPNQLRLQFGISMEEPDHPFHGMPEKLTEGPFNYDWQHNPRIAWIVSTLNQQGLEVSQSELSGLDGQWSVASGQFSDAMRNNAIWALTAAMVSILIYITIRFEFKFAVASIIALLHDVLLSLGLLAILRFLGLGVQIDLAVIGAVMTIIGYSLNDTIIVFDRIREDMHIYRKWNFRDIVNHAVNVTLGRTILTSSTTFIVLLCLVIMGGPSIFTFSLVMAIGVFIGTLSSLFIAGPTLLFLHNREAHPQPSPVKA